MRSEYLFRHDITGQTIPIEVDSEVLEDEIRDEMAKQLLEEYLLNSVDSYYLDEVFCWNGSSYLLA